MKDNALMKSLNRILSDDIVNGIEMKYLDTSWFSDEISHCAVSINKEKKDSSCPISHDNDLVQPIYKQWRNNKK